MIDRRPECPHPYTPSDTQPCYDITSADTRRVEPVSLCVSTSTHPHLILCIIRQLMEPTLLDRLPDRVLHIDDPRFLQSVVVASWY